MGTMTSGPDLPIRHPQEGEPGVDADGFYDQQLAAEAEAAQQSAEGPQEATPEPAPQTTGRRKRRSGKDVHAAVQKVMEDNPGIERSKAFEQAAEQLGMAASSVRAAFYKVERGDSAPARKRPAAKRAAKPQAQEEATKPTPARKSASSDLTVKQAAAAFDEAKKAVEVAAQNLRRAIDRDLSKLGAGA